MTLFMWQNNHNSRSSRINDNSIKTTSENTFVASLAPSVFVGVDAIGCSDKKYDRSKRCRHDATLNCDPNTCNDLVFWDFVSFSCFYVEIVLVFCSVCLFHIVAAAVVCIKVASNVSITKRNIFFKKNHFLERFVGIGVHKYITGILTPHTHPTPPSRSLRTTSPMVIPPVADIVALCCRLYSSSLKSNSQNLLNIIHC